MNENELNVLCALQTEEIERLREAVRLARNTFAKYADLQAERGTPEAIAESKRNYELESRMQSALTGSPVFVVQLEEGVWLAPRFAGGDPPRALRVENARRFYSEAPARAAIKLARHYHPFKDAKVCSLNMQG